MYCCCFVFQTKGKSDHYWIVGVNENPQQLRCVLNIKTIFMYIYRYLQFIYRKVASTFKMKKVGEVPLLNLFRQVLYNTMEKIRLLDIPNYC